MDELQNHYKVLGLSLDASQKDVMESYISLAAGFSNNPDREDFTKVIEAYDVLYDSERIRKYDQKIKLDKSSNNSFISTIDDIFDDREIEELVDHNDWNSNLLPYNPEADIMLYGPEDEIPLEGYEEEIQLDDPEDE